MKPSHLPISLFAPSGRVTDTLSMYRGIEYLQELSFEVRNTECIDRSHERFAGQDAQRALEINSLPYIVSTLGPCIALAVRGGYGLTRLLPMIDWDALAKAVDQGLLFVGHSDLTALEIGLFAKTGRKSFAGPMLGYDFGCIPSDRSEFTIQHFLKAVEGSAVDYSSDQVVPLLTSEGMKAQGVLWGGNLSILNSLLGTSYFPDNSLIRNGILFIEDVNEQPYRIERMLFQLLQSGILGSQQAVLFGDFSSYQLSSLDNGFDLNACIARIQDELKLMGSSTTIFTQLPFGHCRDKLTLPVGVNCQITYENQQFSLKTV